MDQPLPTAPLPRIIQGGMGVGVSNWRLARTVSRTGQLGVVSGTMIDTVVARRLQDGDPGGHVRRALAAFPIPGVADEILARWFRPEGRAPGTPYTLVSMHRQRVSPARQRLTIAANFVEVWLAKEGHDGLVGTNLLTKVQMPNLASLYGAMLADVDYVIMGAGIPREIPAVLDAFANQEPARLKFEIDGLAKGEEEWLTFDPREHWTPTAPLRRPMFLAIVSANSLAATLARKASGRVDGFVVEGPTAGGHNAPPRGELRLNDRGEPLYGERDVVDLGKMRELGIPFWLAGGTGTPEGLQAALAAGAAGVQVGTLFAYSDESGLMPDLKARVLGAVRTGDARVITDPRASPTGYPFKVVAIAGDEDAPKRPRKCDLGYLRTAVRDADGRTHYRCASEPVEDYLAKGGTEAETVGRKCLCNGLASNIGLAQWRTDTLSEEPELVTSGDELLTIGRFVGDAATYSATDVVRYLEGQLEVAPPTPSWDATAAAV